DPVRANTGQSFTMERHGLGDIEVRRHHGLGHVPEMILGGFVERSLAERLLEALEKEPLRLEPLPEEHRVQPGERVGWIEEGSNEIGDRVPGVGRRSRLGLAFDTWSGRRRVGALAIATGLAQSDLGVTASLAPHPLARARTSLHWFRRRQNPTCTGPCQVMRVVVYLGRRVSRDKLDFGVGLTFPGPARSSESIAN